MGSDNLFHKRKAQRVASLARPKREKPQKPKYLIVCEGSVTEPNYFNGLRNLERLPTAHVVIFGEECDSDPLSVVEYAVQQYEAEKLDRFDEVFCVIDRDGHSNFNPAVSRVDDLKMSGGRSQESSATVSQSGSGQFHGQRLFWSFPVEGLARTAVHQFGNVV
ncbi:RloB family protein [Burkholderia ubonensis]|uniref:RloB family protein n=1 Tax=Burkholderia ubonensis TaxID=101571 RepID=UPI0009B4327F